MQRSSKDYGCRKMQVNLSEEELNEQMDACDASQEYGRRS